MSFKDLQDGFKELSAISKEFGEDTKKNTVILDKFINQSQKMTSAAKKIEKESSQYRGWLSSVSDGIEYFMTTSDKLPKFGRRLAYSFKGVFSVLNKANVHFRVAGLGYNRWRYG